MRLGNGVRIIINPTFWKDKRVFVTGHTGFKGSWLSLWLISLGAKVTGYALEPETNPNLFHLCRVNFIIHLHEVKTDRIIEVDFSKIQVDLHMSCG